MHSHEARVVTMRHRCDTHSTVRTEGVEDTTRDNANEIATRRRDSPDWLSTDVPYSSVFPKQQDCSR